MRTPVERSVFIHPAGRNQRGAQDCHKTGPLCHPGRSVCGRIVITSAGSPTVDRIRACLGLLLPPVAMRRTAAVGLWLAVAGSAGAADRWWGRVGSDDLSFALNGFTYTLSGGLGELIELTGRVPSGRPTRWRLASGPDEMPIFKFSMERPRVWGRWRSFGQWDQFVDRPEANPLR